MILGGDFGNFNIKMMGDYGAQMLLSTLGEYRPLKLADLTDNDLVYEFNGKKGFAGDLAERESEFKRSMMGETKAHDDLLIRVLLGLHRYSDSREYRLVIGQPYEMHNDQEKKYMKELLKGAHEFTLNDVKKTIVIRNVEVAVEGAAAFWCHPVNDLVRILDIGSGTVNGATIRNKRYIDKECFGLNYGMNTNKSNDIESLCEAIITKANKWNKNDYIRLIGGSSESVAPYLQRYFKRLEIFYPKVRIGDRMTALHPVYANAVGFYYIGKSVYR